MNPFIAQLPPVRGQLTADAAIGKQTWFGVGGTAEVLFRPADLADLAEFFASLPPRIPVTVVGVGSNLLVRDGGIPGVVIRLGRGFAAIEIEHDEVRAGAAALGRIVAFAAADAGLGGVEFLSGIPGSVGGSLRMNAGAYGREIKDVLVSAIVLDRTGKTYTVDGRAMGLSYRHSDIDPSWVIIEARLRGAPGNRAAISRRLDEIRAAREATQPVRARTGGSTFKNPPGESAWRLIDAAGCRGLVRGGAMVSQQHTNFLINTGTATAADLEGLGEEVRRRVHDISGILLEWEIERIGHSNFEMQDRNSSFARKRESTDPSGWTAGPPCCAQVHALGPRFRGGDGNTSRGGPLRKTVAVVMGGWSPERAVSLSSGRECAKALVDRGYEVRTIDVGRNLPGLMRALDPRPDLIFNALHGVGGEDGTVQGVFEMLGIPYTHSGILASAMAMHKPTAKAVFRDAGLPVAEGVVASRKMLLESDPMPAPFVVKPTNQGSSVGVRIVRINDNSWREEVMEWCYGAELLIERFVPGRELTVAVMGDRALGACEIVPRGSFYDYTAKYTAGGSDHLTPAPVPPAVYEEALDIGLRAHRALGCRGVSRADLRYDDTPEGCGCLYLLEVNTQPGMTPTSLVPDIARHVGIGFDELVAWMVENASCDG